MKDKSLKKAKKALKQLKKLKKLDKPKQQKKAKKALKQLSKLAGVELGLRTHTTIVLAEQVQVVSKSHADAAHLELVTENEPAISKPQVVPELTRQTPANSEDTQSSAGEALILKQRLYQPLKSSPCKKCPALRGDMCKCARKKFAA